MIKSILISGSIVFSSLLALAQEKSINSGHFAKNSIYVELVGTGGLYSINLDRILSKSGSLGFAGRIGFTYTPVIEDFNDIGGPGVNFELSALFGESAGLFELGLGSAYHYLFDEPDIYHLLVIVPRIGYRNQKREGGFFYRIALTPWVPVAIDNAINQKDFEPNFAPMLGISIGCTLRE